VLGELLMTAGVLVLLFLGWQLWLNDLVQGRSQNEAAAELSESWAATPPADEGGAGGADDEADPTAPADPGVPVEPVVRDAPDAGRDFATIVIPRLGEDYRRTITEGTTPRVLTESVGHYAGTQMPGEVGNFAVAGHRTTYGAPFHDLAELRIGDPVYVETEDGWYVYRYRNTVFVPPTGIQVIDPVPQVTDVEPGDRLLTMTTCNPMFSAAERMIAFAVFDRFVPRSAGAPDGIAAAGA